MAFAMTNRLFATGDAAYLPAPAHSEREFTLAAGVNTPIIENTTTPGLKWVRFKFNVKVMTGLVAGSQVVVTVVGGTGAAITNPEQIAQRIVRMETGDLSINGEAIGSSQNGFQSYKVLISTLTTAGAPLSIAPVVDVMVDCG
jgi:hypothetical protein